MCTVLRDSPYRDWNGSSCASYYASPSIARYYYIAKRRRDVYAPRLIRKVTPCPTLIDARSRAVMIPILCLIVRASRDARGNCCKNDFGMKLRHRLPSRPHIATKDPPTAPCDFSRNSSNLRYRVLRRNSRTNARILYTALRGSLRR